LAVSGLFSALRFFVLKFASGNRGFTLFSHRSLANH